MIIDKDTKEYIETLLRKGQKIELDLSKDGKTLTIVKIDRHLRKITIK